jgi:hypothetical protein
MFLLHCHYPLAIALQIKQMCKIHGGKRQHFGPERCHNSVTKPETHTKKINIVPFTVTDGTVQLCGQGCCEVWMKMLPQIYRGL